jgi:hypothetical protein
MFLPITQFVQCPQEIIASSVRLEPAKQRLNLLWEIGGTADGLSHVRNITGERERGVLGLGRIGGNRDAVSRRVEGFSQIANQVSSEIAERFWKGLDKFYLVNLPARCLRIGFDNLCVWFEVVELPDSPVEIGKEIFLSPSEFNARTSKVVRHDYYCTNPVPEIV